MIACGHCIQIGVGLVAAMLAYAGLAILWVRQLLGLKKKRKCKCQSQST